MDKHRAIQILGQLSTAMTERLKEARTRGDQKAGDYIFAQRDGVFIAIDAIRDEWDLVPSQQQEESAE